MYGVVLLGDVGIVCDQYDCLVVFMSQLGYEVENYVGVFNIQIFCWFVCQKDGGLVCESLGDSYVLLFIFGKMCGEVMCFCIEVYGIEEYFGLSGYFGWMQVVEFVYWDYDVFQCSEFQYQEVKLEDKVDVFVMCLGMFIVGCGSQVFIVDLDFFFFWMIQ